MIHRTTFAARIFKWLVTLLLLADLAVPPTGMVVLAATRSPARGKQTQSSKREAQHKPAQAVSSARKFAGLQTKLGRISLTALDLNRAPTEEELKMAGQLGSPLSPSRSADPAKIADSNQRKKQEDDNLLFGQAIQKWNQHDYGEAIDLFQQLRSEHPDSPWAGEAELHIGCARQFQGSWAEAQSSFEWILGHHDKGSDIYQKAKLRRSILHVDQGQLDEAIDSFKQMLETETDWGRRTYAQSWLQRISIYKANEIALRDCGAKSVAYVLRQKGSVQNADKASRSPAPGSSGFSLGDLARFARKFGLTPRAVRASRAQLRSLPVPFIAHYSDQHFVVVTGHGTSGSIKLFDPRLDRPTELTGDQFDQQWSGLALIFAAPPKKIKLATTTELAREMGGCCGSPRYPSNLGPNDDAPPNCGMPGWWVNPVNFNLVVQDVPMWYDSEIGPKIAIGITYNSQDSLNQLRPFGNKWIFNYASYAMESPGGYPAGSVLIVMPGGRGDVYQPNGQGGYVSPPGIFNSLVKLGAYTFDLQLIDGTIYHYGVPPGMNGYSSLLLSIEDRNHNFATVNHDFNGAITGITDPQNRTWVLTYNGQGLVSRVDDPFGRNATFSYDANNNLTGQTDMGGLSYGYSYDGDVYLTSVSKPSGTTSFHIEPNLGGYAYRITVTDPLGFSEEYYYDAYVGSYRDKNQYLQGNGPKTVYNYTIVGGEGVISKITYADGKTFSYSDFYAPRQPQTITDENGHVTKLTYNSKGRVLTRADARNVPPANQYMTTYTYAANNIDLVKVTDYFHDNAHPAFQIGYDGNRNITSVVDGLGRSTAISYAGLGQPETVTDANTQVRTFNYGASHRLTSVTQNGNTLLTITPDTVGRIGNATNVNGYTLSCTYDGLNRPVRVIYPDGSYTEKQWGCCHLDSQRDRAGNLTTFTYDRVNRLTQTRDAENRLMQYVYDPAGNLTQLIDPNWNYTQWQYDNRNRVSKKIYTDGSQYLYDYDGVGNLLHQTDAKGLVTTYGYDVVNNLTTIAATGLATIGFAYDSLNRRTQMTDGTGTTTFGYDLASQLTIVDGPLADDTVSLSYDALGRMSGRSVNNVGTASLVYDNYGRPQTATNPLGTFTYNYPNPVSTLLSSITSTNGPNVSFSYLDVAHDQRLGEIWHKDSGNQTISKFDYEYDVLGQITTWTQQRDANSAQHYNFDYDHVRQLKAATLRDASDAILKSYSYDYDLSGNRTSEVIDTSVNGEIPNNLNQLTNRQGGTGMLPIRGTANEPAWVFVNGNYAPSKPDNSFEGRAAVTPGDNTVTVEAIDQNGNPTTNQYTVTVTGSGSKTLSYDPNGNLVSDSTRTFEWDPLNRLTAVTSGTHRSEFMYNGLSQRVKILEKDNGNITSTKQFVWIPRAAQPAEEGDESNNVTKRYYPQGVQIGATNYYYTRDHLGSIREFTDNSGIVQTRYDYDPYGRRTKLSGSLDVDLGFTGFYFHGASALNFSRTRPYDSDLGRWINRDSISELGGINLYGYVSNNPIIFIDPLGLWAVGLTGFLVDAGIATGVGITIATASPAVVLAALAIGAAILLTPTSIGSEPAVGSLQSQSSMAPPGRPPCPPKAPAAAPDPGDPTTVIGRVKDLQDLGPGEQSLLDRLPDLGNAKPNWSQNSSVLRQEMNRGLPIRDASPGDTGGQFLNAERNLLQNRGWTFDPETNFWNPPHQ